MKILLLSLSTLGFVFCSGLKTILNKKSDKCDTVHFINSKNYSFEVGDTIKSNGVFYIPLDCAGNLKVLEFYRNGKLYSETSFEGLLQTKVVMKADPITFEMEEKHIKYYKRIATGTWTYYKGDGTILKSITIE